VFRYIKNRRFFELKSDALKSMISQTLRLPRLQRCKVIANSSQAKPGHLIQSHLARNHARQGVHNAH